MLNFISFGTLYSHFCLFQGIFYFPFDFFLDPLGFFKNVLFNFNTVVNSLVFLLLLISSFIPLWLLKNTWFGFNIIRFAQVCFVTSRMIYTGECSISAREGGICCYRWVGCSASAKCIYSTAQLTSNVSSLIFCVGEPSNVESGVLNSTATIIYSSLPLFRTVSIHSIYLGAPYVGCIYIYSCYTHRMN